MHYTQITQPKNEVFLFSNLINFSLLFSYFTTRIDKDKDSYGFQYMRASLVVFAVENFQVHIQEREVDFQLLQHFKHRPPAATSK